MRKFLLALFLTVAALPFAGLADPTPTNTPTDTFTPTPTLTWTAIPQTPVAPYVGPNGIPSSSQRFRSAEYVYDATILDSNGKRMGAKGQHPLKLVQAIGNYPVPYNAFIMGVISGPIEECFNDGGSSTFSIGTPEDEEAFVGSTNTSQWNTCGDGDSTQPWTDAGMEDVWKRIGTDEGTGAKLLNDLPIIATIGGSSITKGRKHCIIYYYQPYDNIIVNQTGTLTPTPGP